MFVSVCLSVVALVRCERDRRSLLQVDWRLVELTSQTLHPNSKGGDTTLTHTETKPNTVCHEYRPPACVMGQPESKPAVLPATTFHAPSAAAARAPPQATPMPQPSHQPNPQTTGYLNHANGSRADTTPPMAQARPAPYPVADRAPPNLFLTTTAAPDCKCAASRCTSNAASGCVCAHRRIRCHHCSRSICGYSSHLRACSRRSKSQRVHDRVPVLASRAS